MTVSNMPELFPINDISNAPQLELFQPDQVEDDRTGQDREKVIQWLNDWFNKVELFCSGTRGRRAKSFSEFDVAKAFPDFKQWHWIVSADFVREHNNGFNCYSYTPTDKLKRFLKLPVLGWFDVATGKQD